MSSRPRNVRYFPTMKVRGWKRRKAEKLDRFFAVVLALSNALYGMVEAIRSAGVILSGFREVMNREPPPELAEYQEGFGQPYEQAFSEARCFEREGEQA
jgi:hypothetical protein